MNKYLRRHLRRLKKKEKKMEYQGYQGEFPQYRVPTGWKVKKESNNGAVQCSFIKTPTVYIEPMVRHKIELLMKEYSHQEWLGYLMGRVSEKENFFVENLTIPPHKEAFPGSAEAEPFHIPKNCIGVIHSHHTMGAFHSGTDQNYVDKNFLVSITVAKKAGQELEFDAISYQTTLCGKGTTVKCPVKYVLPPPLFDTEGFLEKAKGNIDKGKRIFTPYQGAQSYKPPEPKIPCYRVDALGNVMTQKEIDDVMNNIWD